MNLNLTAFFKGVSDPTRVKIMTLLKNKEMSVTEIVSHFSMTQPSISHHLNVLKTAGILTSRKDGKEVYYKLEVCCIVDCCGGFRAMFNDEKETI
ncbi:MAG: winged helix-turn-helix transcriptional regulator [Candidatus Marinimicrobia bacterium]|nr:winged helix-turn-helix transcriptional regulator [Candidatus Neomarinimicrobiota bacterium]